MPNILIPIPSVAQTVSRPVFIDMIQQVQKLTNIDSKTKIFYPGDIQKMQTPGSSIDNDDRFAIFNTDRYTFIEIEDDFDEQALATTAIERNEHPSIFEDVKLGVEIKPVYATTSVTINFNYRCPSKSEALRWRDETRTRISKMMDINLHKVKYHYQIPIDVIIILQEIHRKREANYPYGQDFVEYVTSHADPRLTLTGNVIGQEERLAIAETQTRIQGMYTWDAMPEKAQRDDTTGTWSISFGYKFSFEKPIELHIRYPIIVHNQLLDPDFIEFTDKAYDVEKDTKNFSKSFHAMHAFEIGTIMANKMNTQSIIRIPSYDDYVIPDVRRGTGTVLIALAEIDPNKRSILNLKELGDYVIDPDILDFITTSEHLFIIDSYKSILNIALYRNGFLTRDNILTCNSNGDIVCTEDLDPRNQHRVRLSICVDITLLDTRALVRLKNNPKALIKIIGAMNQLLKNHPDFNDLGNKSFISNNDFDSITSFLTGYRIPLGSTETYAALDNGQPFTAASLGLDGNNAAALGSTDISISQTQGFNPRIKPRSNGLPGVYVGSARPGANNLRVGGSRYLTSNSALTGRRPSNLGLFSDIDPLVAENYRRNAMAKVTVLCSAIIALRQEN